MKHGFTLIEIIVAVALFAAVMVVSVGAILSISDASRKAQGVRSAMDNLNFVLEAMAREMRVGSSYHCITGPALPVSPSGPEDCSDTGGSAITFLDSSGVRVWYTLSDGVIKKFEGTVLADASQLLEVTAPEITVDTLSFYVSGSLAGEGKQPRIWITVTGSAETGKRVRTEFQLQTTVSQRLIDS